MDFMSLDEAKVKLQSFEDDPKMKTEGRYSPSANDWPNNIMPFSKIHINYLSKNKSVDPRHYLSNLRLMISIRK